MDETSFIIRPAQARRIIGTGLLLNLGALFFWVAATEPGLTGLARAVPGAFGVLALWSAVEVWRATAHGLELTGDELRDTSGRLVARMEDIVATERGVFAFKPSNGALLRTRDPASMAWVPGVWWRYGRRIGIGGMTPKHETKAMAEIIELRLRERLAAD